MIRVEWDEAKNEANRRKHGISFEAALSVFFDRGMVLTEDRILDGELRWHAVGMSSEALMLTVVHTLRGGPEQQGEEIIRIILARKANRQELEEYGRQDRQIQ